VVKTGNVARVAFAAELRKTQDDVVRFREIPTAAKPDFHFLLDTAGTAVLVPAGAR